MSTPSARYMDLPFDEAIAFFRNKLNLPTATWLDLWHEMHGRAFTVAGAMQEELLDDIRMAIDRAIADGTTITDFRETFDETVARHGWDYQGGRNWRTAVIFNTNLSVAYARGHYEQMTDPDVARVRPYFRYVPSPSLEPRVEHMAWYNLVLPHDDPFWDTHYPPNGWGCKCGIASVSRRELAQLKEEMAGSPHPIKTGPPTVKHYAWRNKKTGEIHNIPRGIDPGWDYHPGRQGFKDHI